MYTFRLEFINKKYIEDFRGKNSLINKFLNKKKIIFKNNFKASIELNILIIYKISTLKNRKILKNNLMNKI